MEVPQGPAYKAHHEYIAQKDDELTLAVNDAVIVTDKADAGWWIGIKVSTKETGWFPSNFVMPVDGDTESKTSTNYTDGSKVLARVEHEYTAQAPDELSLRKGGVVIIIEQNEGWWKGDLNGNVGVFPSNYVSVIKADEPLSDGSQELSDQPKPFKLAAYGVKQGGIGSLFAGGIPPLKKGGTLQRKKSSLPTPPKEPETAFSKSDVPPLPNRESENEVDTAVVMRVMVKFDYHAVNADEVSLAKGTYVDVYDTEADRGWFSGRNEDGLVGLFPANFVEELRNTDATEDIAAPKSIPAERDVEPDCGKKTTVTSTSEPKTADAVISKGSEHNPPSLPSRPLESTENGSSAPLETTNKARFGGIKVLPGAVPLMPLGAVPLHNKSAKGNTVEIGQQDPVLFVASSAPRKPAKPSSPIPELPGDNGPLSPQSPVHYDPPVTADVEVSLTSVAPEIPARPSSDNSAKRASPAGGFDLENQDSKSASQELPKRLSFVPPKPPVARKPQLQGHEISLGRDDTREIGETSQSHEGVALSTPSTSRSGSPVKPATPAKHHTGHASKKSSAPNSPTKSQSASSPAQPPKILKRDTVGTSTSETSQQRVGSEAGDSSDAYKEDVDGSDVQSGNESSRETLAETRVIGAPKLSHLTKARVSGPKSRRQAESGSGKDKGLGVIEQMIEDVNQAPSPTKEGAIDATEPSDLKAKSFKQQPTSFVLAGGVPAALKHVTTSKNSLELDGNASTQAPFSPPCPSPASMSSPQPDSHRSMVHSDKAFSMDSAHKGYDESEVITRRVFEQLRKELENRVAEERAARRKLEAEVRDLRLLMQDEFKKLRRTMAG